jgi:hypothetical protein
MPCTLPSACPPFHPSVGVCADPVNHADARVTSVGFDESAGGAVLLSNYTAVLEGLLRLRQVCCCPTMVPPERIAAARRMLEVLGKHREDTQGAVEITQAQAQSLFAKLKQVSSCGRVEEPSIRLRDRGLR